MSSASLLNRALDFYQRGDLVSALDTYRSAVKADPQNPYGWDGLGFVLRATGDMDGALDAAVKATVCDPDTAQFWSNLGNSRAAMGNDRAALNDYDQALRIAPGYAEAWANKGMAEKRLKRNADAAVSLVRAAALMSGNPPALNNIGNQLFELDAFEAAQDCYENAVRVDPAFTNAWNNLGNTWFQLLQLSKAVDAYGQALSNEPAHGEAGNGLAQALLMSGNFVQGWPAYEARFNKPNTPGRPTFAAPTWSGQDLAGKTLLLFAEQGLGDTIQFLRFTHLIKQAGAHVILECPESLVSLASLVAGIDQAVTSAAGITADFCLTLMSLPHVLKLHTVNHLTMEEPYIKITAAKLPPTKNKKIGLVWSGNPDHINDKNRSLNISDLTALLETPAVDFHSLQQGPGQHQLGQFANGNLLKNTSRTFDNFAETAAAISELDLLITVDTSIAHLAGAMNRPCWLLVPFVPDWRWMLDRERTFWYPSLRLFRQTDRGDWKSVIRRVSEAIRVDM